MMRYIFSFLEMLSIIDMRLKEEMTIRTTFKCKAMYKENIVKEIKKDIL